MYHNNKRKREQHSPKPSSGLYSLLDLEWKHKDGASVLPVRVRDPTGLPWGPRALPARVPFFSLDWCPQSLAAATRPWTGMAPTGASSATPQNSAEGRWWTVTPSGTVAVISENLRVVT